MTSRIEVIQEVLVYHYKRKTPDGLECGCGYKYRFGESIARHPAEVIDAALTYAEPDQ